MLHICRNVSSSSEDPYSSLSVLCCECLVVLYKLPAVYLHSSPFCDRLVLKYKCHQVTSPEIRHFVEDDPLLSKPVAKRRADSTCATRYCVVQYLF